MVHIIEAQAIIDQAIIDPLGPVVQKLASLTLG
jgi:hypothetical protein